MPAPEAALPLAMVKPESEFVVPMLKEKIVPLKLPLIVRRLAPGPTILVLAAIAGNDDVKTIVSDTFVIMTCHGFGPPALTSRIACRKEPGAESVVLLTMRGASSSTRRNEALPLVNPGAATITVPA